MRNPRYLSDIIVSIVSIVLGLLIATFLHAKWYYGGWMTLFGDPPADNLAYDRVMPILSSVPYIAAGFASGLLSGFGCPQATRIFIRSSSLLVSLAIYASKNLHLSLCAYIPTATSSFLLSTFLSFVYFRLLSNARNS